MSGYYATGKRALGICDRCGFQFKLKELKEVVVNDEPSNLRVCRECWEEDHPQNRQGKMKIYDPQALHDARPDDGETASRILSGPEGGDITPEALDALIASLGES